MEEFNIEELPSELFFDVMSQFLDVYDLLALCKINKYFKLYDTYENWIMYYKLKYLEYYKIINLKNVTALDIIKEILLIIYNNSNNENNNNKFKLLFNKSCELSYIKLLTYIIDIYKNTLKFVIDDYKIVNNIFKNGNLDVIKLLFDTKFINIKSDIINKAIINSAKYGHIKIFKYLYKNDIVSKMYNRNSRKYKIDGERYPIKYEEERPYVINIAFNMAYINKHKNISDYILNNWKGTLEYTSDFRKLMY